MWISESAACAWMSHVYVGMSGCQGSAIQIQPHIWNTSHARVLHKDFLRTNKTLVCKSFHQQINLHDMFAQLSFYLAPFVRTKEDDFQYRMAIRGLGFKQRYIKLLYGMMKAVNV